jgi:hypothetical protein
VEQQDAVQPEHAEEWRGHHRVQHRLAEVEAGRVGIVLLGHADKRKGAVQADLQELAAFEEDPFGTAMVDPGEALEVAAGEAEIAVVGGAQRGSDVSGLVAFDAVAGARDVRRHGERAGDQKDRQPGDRRTTVARLHSASHDAAAPDVRNDRSARSTPWRCVDRETS